MEKMPSSSDEATPPQGSEIWSVPFVPNSEIAHNTMVEKMSSSSDGATPPQGPEIWSVLLDPNAEIAHYTVLKEDMKKHFEDVLLPSSYQAVTTSTWFLVMREDFKLLFS